MANRLEKQNLISDHDFLEEKGWKGNLKTGWSTKDETSNSSQRSEDMLSFWPEFKTLNKRIF